MYICKEKVNKFKKIMGNINSINQKNMPGLMNFGMFDYANIPINKHKELSNNIVKTLMNEIINWCKENIKGYNVSFEIDEDKNLIIKGNCYIDNTELTKLPYRIHKVIGNFSVCGDLTIPRTMHLQTLENFPRIVTGNFNISGNPDLVSLAGGPVEVGGYYRCSHCNIKTMVGMAKKIGSYISAFSNPLVDITALDESTFTNIDLDFCDAIKDSSTYKMLNESNRIYR